MSLSEKVEVKGVIKDIVNKLVGFFSLDAFKVNVSNFLKTNYDKSMREAELEFNMNFVPSDDLSFLEDYAFENVKDVTDEINSDLRKVISQSVLNKDSKKDMVDKVKTSFDNKKYNNRLKMIMRTEGLRANNQAQMDSAEQSGLKLLKYLSVIMDDRTSEICKAENKKYGSKEQAIPLEDDFKVIVKVGKKVKDISAKMPPFHINCRSVVRFVRKD